MNRHFLLSALLPSLALGVSLDAGDPTPGISLLHRAWPHGWSGTAIPHGTVFSR